MPAIFTHFFARISVYDCHFSIHFQCKGISFMKWAFLANDLECVVCCDMYHEFKLFASIPGSFNFFVENVLRQKCKELIHMELLVNSRAKLLTIESHANICCKNLYFTKGAAKLHLTDYLHEVIMFFSEGLCKSPFSNYSYVKLGFRLCFYCFFIFRHSFSWSMFWIRCHFK